MKACLTGFFNRDSGDRPYQLEFSRVSGKGKYVSLTLNLEVRHEQERNDLFRTLAGRPEIRLVI